MLEEARRAVEWLREKLALQERCAKTDDPAVLAADIRKREDTVVRFCDLIMSRAPPPPPKVRPQNNLGFRFVECNAG